MNIYRKLLAFCLLNAGVWEAAAFSVSKASKRSSVVLRSTPDIPVEPEPEGPPETVAEAIADPPVLDLATTGAGSFQPDEALGAFPTGANIPLQKIQGGKSRVTWKMPPGVDRVQYYLETNGRPMKAKVCLWCGPIRQTHMMDVDCHDGKKTPFRGLLKFKHVDSAGPQVLEISTTSTPEFPVWCGVDIPSIDRCEALGEMTEKVWKTPVDTTIKTYSQGGKVVRYVNIPVEWDKTQVVFWATDVGKKSMKAKIELLQGPNNKKQQFDMACGGGSQPYHFVVETPGVGWTLRLTNKKNLEDGSFEFAVAPFEAGQNIGSNYVAPPQKQWWQ